VSQSRRDFLKVSAAGVAALSQGAYAFGVPAAPKGEIDVRLTAGAARFAPQASVKWQSLAGMSGATILLDPTKAYQEVLGVGAALTEAACYMFNRFASAGPRTVVSRALSSFGDGFRRLPDLYRFERLFHRGLQLR